ncbi:hypothetical protein DEJ01_15210 [Curtobacterium sp. MCLR17_040]|nr:hypothetical protein DEJ01_15210 [Curtobacterium sp. MCLR17_040]
MSGLNIQSASSGHHQSLHAKCSSLSRSPSMRRTWSGIGRKVSRRMLLMLLLVSWMIMRYFTRW